MQKRLCHQPITHEVPNDIDLWRGADMPGRTAEGMPKALEGRSRAMA